MRVLLSCRFILVGFFSIVYLMAPPAGDEAAFAATAPGNGPLDRSVFQQLPEGVEQVANRSSRLSWWEGPPFAGGEYHFEHQCASTADFNAALKLFAEVRAPELELVVRDGMGKTLQGKDGERMDWSLVVWNPASWHTLHNRPDASYRLNPERFMTPTPLPQITVYVGGPIEWDRVVAPRGIRVIDERVAAAPVPVSGGGMLRGAVFDMSTGRAIPNARVRLERQAGEAHVEAGKQTMTDKEGAYRLERIAPVGRYRVRFSAPGYAPRGMNYQLRQELQYDELQVELVAAAAIRGVVSGVDGTPLANVKVATHATLGLDGRGYSGNQVAALTDRRGRFVLGPVPKGYALLRCTAEGLIQQNPSELYLSGAGGARIVLEATGSIHGKVLGSDRRPRRVARIFLNSLDRKLAWSAERPCPEGAFVFENVPPGRYRLAAAPKTPGGADDQIGAVVIEVKPGAKLEVNIQIPDLVPARP